MKPVSIYFILLSIGYIEKLMNKTIYLCKEDEKSIISEVIPEPLYASYEHPPKADAIQQHRSRFK